MLPKPSNLAKSTSNFAMSDEFVTDTNRLDNSMRHGEFVEISKRDQVSSTQIPKNIIPYAADLEEEEKKSDGGDP